MLERHYSPRTPLVLRGPGAVPPAGAAVILLRKPRGQPAENVFWLSERGVLKEIARNLYRVLRQADAGHHRQIRLEPLTNTAGGLAAAIADRMKRAATKR